MTHPFKIFLDWQNENFRRTYCRIDHTTGRIASYNSDKSWRVVVGRISKVLPLYQHWSKGKTIHEGVERCEPDCVDCQLCGVMHLLTTEGTLIFQLRGKSLDNLLMFLEENHGLNYENLENGFTENNVAVKIRCDRGQGRFYYLIFEKPEQGEKSLV